VLGVCLGHQAIGLEAGGTVDRTTPMHGKASFVYHEGAGSSAGVRDAVRGWPLPLAGGRARRPAGGTRAHGVDRRTGSSWARNTASCRISGVQFHPESILTPEGPRIVENFLAIAR
jgi:anthranilate synthase component 2